VASMTWAEWLVERKNREALPYDDDCVIKKDMEKCQVEECDRWCSTLVECSIHAQMDMKKEDDE
jgi:hypothetical protein